ncbi:MAG TPA: hypothetical protein VM093_03885 [Aeromicrobium sp.]|nr:hypothetical protein [Aeromicrobium sp.]
MAGSKLPGELTWPKLLGTSIAAVFTAWLAGRLGLGGTLTGVAIGSVIATFGSAFFTSTIDRTHQTLLVRTERGTVVETRGDSDVHDSSATTVLPAQPAQAFSPDDAHPPSRWSQIHWGAVVVAALVTMGVTLAAISLYEGAVGRTWGSNEPGTTIGNTVHGGPRPTASAPAPTETPSAEPSEKPSDEPSPSAEPSESPTPSPSPTPTDCPTATPAPGAVSPTPQPTNCPTPGASGEPTDSPLLP